MWIFAQIREKQGIHRHIKQFCFAFHTNPHYGLTHEGLKQQLSFYIDVILGMGPQERWILEDV